MSEGRNRGKRQRKRIWSTSQPVFDKLNAEFGFTVDLCADHVNRKCERFIPTSLTLAIDVLWDGIGFLNPPYGDVKTMGAFMAKAVRSTRDYMGTVVVALIPTNTNAPWWHDWVMRASEIRFVRKKLPFVSNDGKKGVPFTGHAIVVFREGQNDGPRVRSWEQP
jgi:phage N-6-adenine-methyltransferase